MTLLSTENVQQESIPNIFHVRIWICFCFKRVKGAGGPRNTSYWSLIENNQMPASVYIQDEALHFLISSLSNLDHLEGTWAARPQILVSVTCLCTGENQAARHTIIFLLCFKGFYKTLYSSLTFSLPQLVAPSSIGPWSTWCLSSLTWLTQCAPECK